MSTTVLVSRRQNTISSKRGTANETGRVSRTKGAHLQGMFKGVALVRDFARVLQVPAKALDLVVLDDAWCAMSGCLHIAIRGNCGYCLAQRRGLYPLLISREGNCFDPAFLRIAGKFLICYCSQPACNSAGYFLGQDAIYIPTAGLQTALKALNLLSLLKNQQLKDKTRKCFYLYAWHSFPEHQTREEGDSLWKLDFIQNEY